MPEQLKRPAAAAVQEDIRSYFSRGYIKKKKIVTEGTENTAPSMQDELPEKQQPDENAVVEVEGFLDMIPSDWKALLSNICSKKFFKDLEAFVTKDSLKHVLYPPRSEIFSALVHCPVKSLKVVILGQDPYHGPSQAHGLCFSVQKGVKVPPSLVNIYKETGTDVGTTRPSHGCLTDWSKQGVLLLNTVLTVRKGEANSHQKRGWEELTSSIISIINSELENVVFLLWGRPAGKKAEMINTRKHKVIMSSHPSPLGATKTASPFIGSKCFSRTNEYLVEHGKSAIDWQIKE